MPKDRFISTPDAPGVKDARFPEGAGSGSERIYGVYGIVKDFRVLGRIFSPNPSVDEKERPKSKERAERALGWRRHETL